MRSVISFSLPSNTFNSTSPYSRYNNPCQRRICSPNPNRSLKQSAHVLSASASNVNNDSNSTNNNSSPLLIKLSSSSNQYNAIQQHFQALCADLPASSLNDSNIPLTWPEVLQSLSSKSIIGQRLTKICEKIGTETLLSIKPSTIVQIWNILKDTLKLTYSQRIRTINRNPKLISILYPNNILLVIDSLYQVGLKFRDIRQLILKFPFILNVPHNKILRVSNYFTRPPVNMNTSVLISFIRKVPWIFSLNFESKIVPSINWLDEYVCDPSLILNDEKTRVANKNSVSNIILANPKILYTNREDMTMMRLFLIKFLGIDEIDAIEMLRVFPILLSYDNEYIGLSNDEIKNSNISNFSFINNHNNSTNENSTDNMIGVIQILFKKVKLSVLQLKKVIRSFPSILTLSVNHNILPVVNYFQQQAGIRNIARLIVHLPPILGYDLKTNIHPKMSYLLNDIKLSTLNILMFPAVFSYSLKERIIPRTRFLMFLKIRISSLGLNHIITLTDEQYCAQIAKVPLKSYVMFIEYLCESNTSKEAPAKRRRRKRPSDNKSNDNIEFYSAQEVEDEDELKEGRVWGKSRFRATLKRIPWSEI